MALAESIKGTQMLLVERGDKPLESLRLKDDDTSMDFQSRCCY